MKNPKRPAAQIFAIFYFVPLDLNYHPPNFCAIKVIFDRERAKKLKMSLFKKLRQSPTLIENYSNNLSNIIRIFVAELFE